MFIYVLNMKFLHKYIFLFFFHILEISQNDNAVAFNYSILFSIPMTYVQEHKYQSKFDV